MNIHKFLRNAHRPLALLFSILMLFMLFGCANLSDTLEIAGEILELIEDTDHLVTADLPPEYEDETDLAAVLHENGAYYSKDEVAVYIHTYSSLPSNFITKDEARALGWEGGSVERYLEGAAIGGDVFGNREGLLPKADGRIYYECDIDTFGKDSRGAKRIVYSNDGLIYYTDDHYESFTLLYGEE